MTNLDHSHENGTNFYEESQSALDILTETPLTPTLGEDLKQ